jgi:hypothetical protein
MAGHAVRSKCQEMFRGKRLINLQVTIAACILIERRNESALMTVTTHIVLMRV